MPPRLGGCVATPPMDWTTLAGVRLPTGPRSTWSPSLELELELELPALSEPDPESDPESDPELDPELDPDSSAASESDIVELFGSPTGVPTARAACRNT